MKRLLLLIGLLGIVAAGTASAQTRVSVSLGFGVPRPYLAGTVFVGRPLLRPMYRPYFYHHFPRHRYFAPRFHRGRPFLLVPRGDHRERRFQRREHERRFRRHFDRD